MNDKPRLIKQILFVCLGNSCRSPMAEAMFNKLAQKRDLSICAISAGIIASVGNMAANNSIAVMLERGINLKYFRSRVLNENVLNQSDLVLVMEGQQLFSIPEKFQDKAFLLSAYASDSKEDIFDPLGCDIQSYSTCADLIEKHLIKLADALTRY